jgi:WD40 repeat protein
MSDMEQPRGWEAGEHVGGGQDRGTSAIPNVEEPSERGPRTGMMANHDNAIFDMKWSHDDSMLISTCADLSTSVWDTSRTGTTFDQSKRNNGLITKLRGHKASAKATLWSDGSEFRK